MTMADPIPFLTRTPVTLPVLTFFCAILGVGLMARFARSHRNLPPGPPGEFFIGNTRQIPPTYSWFSYTDLAKKYGAFVCNPNSFFSDASGLADTSLGEIIYLSVLG